MTECQAKPARLDQALFSAAAILLVTAIAGSIAVKFGSLATEPELAAVVGATMDKALPDDLSNFSFEAHPHRSALTPIRVFRGKNATVLGLTDVRRVGGLVPRLVRQVLAVTKAGSYFTFSYESDLHAAYEVPLPFFPALPCVATSCRRIGSARPLTLAEAKIIYFNSPAFSPERYKALFHEDAPAKRVDA